MTEEVKAAEQTQLRIDVQTIRPTARAIVTFKGTEYEVLSLIDLPYSQMTEILGIAVAPAPEGESKVVTNITSSRRQLKALVPALSEETLNSMTYREMIAFIESAMGSGENPQSGGPTSS